MKEWFNSYSSFFQGIIIISIVATVIMLIQIILLLIGMGDETSFDGTDIDDPSDLDDVINDNSILDVFGLRILTIRNIIAFFAVGGWTSILFFDWTQKVWLAILLGFVMGVITMFLLAYIFKKALELQSNGNIDIKNAIGKVGTVYLTIPAQKSGIGKVNLIVQERYIEIDAMTEGESIPTGAEIEVEDCLNDMVIVKRK